MTELSTPRAKNIALLLLAMTQFMIIIDASIVNVALPSIGHALSFSQENLSWVVNAYVLAFGGFLLLGGRLADYLGRRRMFIVGLLLFSFASLLGGFAQSEAWLIAARALQGLGAAIVSPAALSIVTTTFAEGAERNRALGVWGALGGAGAAAGVLLGGGLTEWAGWEFVLWVNVPLGLFAAWQAPKRLVESSVDEDERNFDVPGAVTVTAGLALLVYAFVDAASIGWGSSTTLARLVGAALLLGAFVVIEQRTRKPLVPFAIFRSRTRRGANLVALLIGVSLFSMVFFMTLYTQQVLGMSALESGVGALPLALSIIVAAGGSSQFVTRVGFKPMLITGLLFIAGGLAWFAQVDATGGSYISDVLGPSVVAAIGVGLSSVSATIAGVSGSEPHQAGLASGLLNTSQQIGAALGLAILASVANSTTSDALAGGERNPLVALTEGFQDAFLVGAGIALTGALLTAALVSSRDSRAHSAAARRGEAQPVLVAA
jgi:EmrB/QacA subfamily drug resistance transporter